MSEVLIEIRGAVPSDVRNGLGDALRELSPDSPDVPMLFGFRLDDPDRTTLVALVDGKVVGTVSVLIEHKLTHSAGRVAHLEDLAVLPKFRGRGIGRALVDKVRELARYSGCYKVVLSCSPDKKGFYEECGFHQNEISMRCDL